MRLEMNHNRQKKVAVINDYSSFGRCSLAAYVPLLAAQKIQCCPIPTAIFTNHTGFKRFSSADMTERMDAYLEDWLETGLTFSAIASGYLSSTRQLDYVHRFAASFPEATVVVDPVMGDYGKLYPSFRREVAEGLKALLPIADYLTPNLTEACVLTNRAYDPEMSTADVKTLIESLLTPKTKGVVISGVPREGHLVNFVYSPASGLSEITTEKIGPDRSGTGDVFAAVLTGAIVNGASLEAAVSKAVDFVSLGVRRAEEMKIPTTDGLPFEEILSVLWS